MANLPKLCLWYSPQEGRLGYWLAGLNPSVPGESILWMDELPVFKAFHPSHFAGAKWMLSIHMGKAHQGALGSPLQPGGDCEPSRDQQLLSRAAGGSDDSNHTGVARPGAGGRLPCGFRNRPKEKAPPVSKQQIFSGFAKYSCSLLEGAFHLTDQRPNKRPDQPNSSLNFLGLRAKRSSSLGKLGKTWASVGFPKCVRSLCRAEAIIHGWNTC